MLKDVRPLLTLLVRYNDFSDLHLLTIMIELN